MTSSLVNVLRQELDAVNQQFVHILALKAWAEKDAVERITQVDNIDFPNAMRIIDYLVGNELPLDLEPSAFSPGQDRASVLLAEREIETRISRALDAADAADEHEARLLDAARGPRRAYLEWLDEQIGKAPADAVEPPPDAAATAAVVAPLITLLELSMVHAFVHWHAGERQAADAAWMTSGAAMMHLTRLVRTFARLPGIPYPGECPPPGIRQSASDALQSEQQIASLCEREASAAAQRCADKSVAGACGLIGSFCAEFANWKPTNPHPAAATNPQCFQSFEATLGRFVH